MIGLILFLHFVGLMLGSGGGLGGAIVGRAAAARPPEQAQALRALAPVMINVATTGLVFLWTTGLLMVWLIYGGFDNLPGLFWVKLVFVLILTGLVGWTHMTYGEMRRAPSPSLGKRLAMLGPASGVATLLAVLFAAYAFL